MSGVLQGMRLTANAPAQPGEADAIDVMTSGDKLHLTLTRRAQRGDGRDRRSISMFLGQVEAVALGRYLITQAKGLIDLGIPATAKAYATVSDEDELGDYMGDVEVERIAGGDEIIITTGRTHYERHERRELSVWLEIGDARSLALGLLALTQD